MGDMTASTEVLLPTGIVRSGAEEFAGRIRSFLHLHLREFIFVLLVIIFIFIIRKISYRIMASRARKKVPESTNTWFKWEDFEEWKKQRR